MTHGCKKSRNGPKVSIVSKANAYNNSDTILLPRKATTSANSRWERKLSEHWAGG